MGFNAALLDRVNFTPGSGGVFGPAGLGGAGTTDGTPRSGGSRVIPSSSESEIRIGS